MIVVGFGLIEELGKFGAGDNAMAGLIEIHAHDVTATSLHVHTLLAEGHQQILGRETPVKESADLVHRLDAHECEVTHHGFGHLGRCYRAVFTVVIDKNADVVTHLHLGCEVTLGKQHLVGIVVNQVGPEIDHAVNTQLVIFSNLHSLRY